MLVPAILILGPIFVFTVFIGFLAVVGNWGRKRHLRRLLEIRSPPSRQAFVDQLRRAGVSREIANYVWDTLRRQILIPDFPLLPSDDILSIVGLEVDGFENFPFGGLDGALDCREDTWGEFVEFFGEYGQVKTVTDLARFLDTFCEFKTQEPEDSSA